MHCYPVLSEYLRRERRHVAAAERARASTVLTNAIEAMSDGFVMWDENDRLVTWNQHYCDLYAASAPFIVKGARFEDVIRQGAEVGQYPQAEGDIDAFVRRTVAWHRACRGTIERQRALGRYHIAPPAGLDAKLAVLAPLHDQPTQGDAA